MKVQNGVFIEVPFSGQMAGLCINGEEKLFGVALSEYKSYHNNTTLKLVTQNEYCTLIEELNRKKYLDKPPVIITAQYFEELKACSQVENIGDELGIFQFRMGGFETSTITLQAGTYKGVYLTKHIYTYDKSTWLSISDFVGGDS